jgi:hypothetical protein
MINPTFLAEFDRLVREAEGLLDDFERDREPEFEAVLVHVLTHPSGRQIFATKFMELLSWPSTDGDLFEFCMHELRWPEVRSRVAEAMQDAITRNDIRARDFLGHALSAFDDHWLDGQGGGYKRFA